MDSGVSILPDGSLIVPARASAGGVVGDGVVTLAPGTDEHAEWSAWLKRRGFVPTPVDAPTDGPPPLRARE